MPNRYIATGKVVGTHGIRGEMRVQPWCDEPGFLTGFKRLYTSKDGKDELKVTSARVHGNICLIKISGVDSIELAESFRGKVLYIDRADCNLEDGRYFIEDIVGCEVLDNDNGSFLGVITDVSATGANDVWHITKDAKEYLIPNVPEFVKKVDIESQKVYIILQKGILDDED